MDRHKSQELLNKVRAAKEKQANDPVTAVQQIASQQVKSDALNDIGKVMLLSGGAGAGIRGLLGLQNLVRRNASAPARVTQGPAELPLPYPVDPEPEEEEQVKLAEMGTVSGLMAGNYATNKTGLPWYRPAMLMGGLAAGYGGWKAIDHVLDSRRKQDLESELEDSRSQFQKALLSQYDQPLTKHSGDTETEKLAADLDDLFDLFEQIAEKSAESTWADRLGGDVVGNYGMYAGLSGLAAGYAAYKTGQKTNRSAVIAKALKRRERRNASLQPSELFATPVPIETSSI